jgi:hypothetical protein
MAAAARQMQPVFLPPPKAEEVILIACPWKKRPEDCFNIE